LSEALEKYPPQCSTNAQLLLLDAYETTYDIYNHDLHSKGRPLVLVAKQWAEDVSEGSVLFERMEEYHAVGILKFFGIPWDRWIEQPKEINDEQIRKAKKWGEAENKTAEQLQQQLAALKFGQGKGQHL
jgi:hypothetical protein